MFEDDDLDFDFNESVILKGEKDKRCIDLSTINVFQSNNKVMGNVNSGESNRLLSPLGHRHSGTSALFSPT